MRTDDSADLRPALVVRPSRPWGAAAVLVAAAAIGGAAGAASIDVPAPVVSEAVLVAAPEAAPTPLASAAGDDAAGDEMVAAEAVAEVAEEPGARVLEIMARGADRWVLLRAVADEAWLRGKPVIAHRAADSLWIERSVALDRAALPAELVAWTGRAVDVIDRDGNRCAATVESVVGRQFGLTEGDAAVGQALEADWYRTAIVGKLAVTDDRCGAPLYAVVGSGSVAYGSAEPARGRLARRARRAFRTLPAYRRLQAEWAAEGVGGTGRWDEAAGRHDVLSVRLGARRFVLVSGRGDGCGGPDGQLVALWRVTGSDSVGDLVFQRSVSVEGVDAVFDADADGLPDFVVGQDLTTSSLLSSDGDYRLEPGFSIDHDFCRC